MRRKKELFHRETLTRAQVRLNLGNAEGAVADLDACCEAVGDSSALLRDMAGIYEAAGAYEKALELWQITAQDGDLLDRACCYVQLRRMQEAENEVERYLMLDDADGTTANTMLALGFLRGGAYDRADEYFARALSGDGTDPASLYYYVVLCAYLSARYERTVEYGERLLERLERGEENGAAQISVEDTTGRLRVELVAMDAARLCRMVGSSCLVLGDYARAVEVLTLSLEEQDDSAVRYLRGSGLLAAQALAGAVSGEGGAASVAGAVSVLVSSAKTGARLGARTEVAGRQITLEAVDKSRMAIRAGGISVSKGASVGVGASVAVIVSNNAIDASVGDGASIMRTRFTMLAEKTMVTMKDYALPYGIQDVMTNSSDVDDDDAETGIIDMKKDEDSNSYKVSINLKSEDLLKAVDMLNFLSSTNYYVEAIGGSVNTGAKNTASVAGSVAVVYVDRQIGDLPIPCNLSCV